MNLFSLRVTSEVLLGQKELRSWFRPYHMTITNRPGRGLTGEEVLTLLGVMGSS